MLTLGIESSCDETAAAVLEGEDRLLSNIISSQVDVHRLFGGVVPEVAARKHTEIINNVISEALEQAGAGFKDIDLIAVTAGPGLVVSLLVGIAATRVLSESLGIPAVGVNHLEGHMLANFMTDEKPELPAVCLLVSGGHTDIFRIDAIGSYKRLGGTVDDAAGEAFDKVARFLDLGYPGGPAIQTAAETGDASLVRFPRPMIGKKNFDLSFSGLKTAVVNFRKNNENNGSVTSEYLTVNDIAASFQEAVVDVLTAKTVRAAEKNGIKTVLLAGGVAANGPLRDTMRARCEKKGIKFFTPPLVMCTDNAGMIARAGYELFRNKRNSLELSPAPSCAL